jgi:hypothetical protein
MEEFCSSMSHPWKYHDFLALTCKDRVCRWDNNEWSQRILQPMSAKLQCSCGPTKIFWSNGWCYMDHFQACTIAAFQTPYDILIQWLISHGFYIIVNGSTVLVQDVIAWWHGIRYLLCSIKWYRLFLKYFFIFKN